MTFIRKDRIIINNLINSNDRRENKNINKNLNSMLDKQKINKDFLKQDFHTHNVLIKSVKSTLQQKNIAIRNSLITLDPIVSTGQEGLDNLLLHKGIPLGCSLLIEEFGFTDFSSVLLKSFAAQGIVHERLDLDNTPSHVIVFGTSESWSDSLPSLYEKNKKKKHQNNISENQPYNIIYSSLNHKSQFLQNNVKIAWRYGLKDINKMQKSSIKNIYRNYCSKFDITESLNPPIIGKEISFVSISNNFLEIIELITSIIDSQLLMDNRKIIRLLIPNFLNLNFYNSNHFEHTFIFPFIHSLRALLRKYSNNLVLISSISLNTFSNESILFKNLENLFDSVIVLKPFNQEFSSMLEKTYKNDPSKISHGLISILKLPILSDKGLMVIQSNKFVFKNTKHEFEIFEWEIPVLEENNSAIHDTKCSGNLNF